MPVGDEEQAGVLVLELDPVGENAMVMTQMKAARGAHAREDFFSVHGQKAKTALIRERKMRIKGISQKSSRPVKSNNSRMTKP